MTKPKAKPSTPTLGLVDYVKAKRREACRVCQLPDDVRDQLATASDKGIKRGVVLEWLRESVGIKITDSELTVHKNGRHDEQAA